MISNPVPTIFIFQGFNFNLLAIVSSGSKFASLSSFSGGIGGKSSSPKSRQSLSGLFRTFIVFF